MTTIIKEGYEKILSIFYNDKSARLHLRNIARKTNLNENSASRFLNQLEKEKLLISSKDGNLKKYELIKSDIAYSVFCHLDILKFLQLPSIRKNAILYFLNALDEKPLTVVLFGSTAKNNYSDASDIDLLLIVNKKIITEKAEGYADSQTGIKISPLQIRFNDFKEELKLKNDKVVESAINTGYPVTNHIEYYRWLKNERI